MKVKIVILILNLKFTISYISIRLVWYFLVYLLVF